MDNSSDLILREYSWKPLWLAYFWKDKPLWFLKAHNLVVGLQPEHGVLKVRHTVALLIHQHRKINLNVCLGEVVRQFVVIQNRLRNLQTVIIDRTIRVLCQAEFLCKQRTDAKPSEESSMLELFRGAKEENKVKYGPRIWEQLQSPCPNRYWAWCIVVQGNNERGCSRCPVISLHL